MKKINHYVDDVLVQNYSTMPFNKIKNLIEKALIKNSCFDGYCTGCNGARCNLSVSVYDGRDFIIIKVYGDGGSHIYELDTYTFNSINQIIYCN